MLQHLGGHEMAKIMETKVAKFGCAAMTENGFADTIRFPGGNTIVVGEDICIR